ncbi:MAG: Os1348 family NHLP clan protein [Dehalococcoidia bacterium]
MSGSNKKYRKGSDEQVKRSQVMDKYSTDTNEMNSIDRQLEDLLKGQQVSAPEVLSGKDAIMDVLGRAADDPAFMRRMADDAGKTLQEYYTLTAEERAALASGDIRKIEEWVGKLDTRLATWLLYRLSQEKW